jgi:hypothetical protein
MPYIKSPQYFIIQAPGIHQLFFVLEFANIASCWNSPAPLCPGAYTIKTSWARNVRILQKASVFVKALCGYDPQYTRYKLTMKSACWLYITSLQYFIVQALGIHQLLFVLEFTYSSLCWNSPTPLCAGIQLLLFVLWPVL